MPLQEVSIYKFATGMVVCPVCTTTTGIGIASEPYQVLAAPVSADALGQAVCRALNDSFEGIPHPLDWKARALPRWAAAGVRTEAEFQKKSALVTVAFDGATLSISPHRNGGATGKEKGFFPIEEHKTLLKEVEPEAAGAATLRAFELCA